MGPELPSTEIQYVVFSGSVRAYDAATSEEVWRVKRRKLEPLPLRSDLLE